MASQLFKADKVHVTELSSDENEEPSHPQIQAMNSVYFLADMDYITIKKTMADMRGTCVQAICDILNFEHDMKLLFCANTNMYTLLCENKLAAIKRFLHPPDTRRDMTWNTPDKKRASTASRVLLIPCLDETLAHWFLVAIVDEGTNTKRVLIFDSINIDAGKRRIPAVRKYLRKL